VLLGDFTVASSQNVHNLKYNTAGDRAAPVTGKSCIYRLFGVEFGTFGQEYKRLQAAMDDAINNGRNVGFDGDMLVNVRIEMSDWTTIVWGRNCVHVTGSLSRIEARQ
jgi:hypothetical protein